MPTFRLRVRVICREYGLLQAIRCLSGGCTQMASETRPRSHEFYEPILSVGMKGPTKGRWASSGLLRPLSLTLLTPHPAPLSSRMLHSAVTSTCSISTGFDPCSAGSSNICGPGTCVNLPNGYRCVCSPGYQLHPSRDYCTGIYRVPWAC